MNKTLFIVTVMMSLLSGLIPRPAVLCASEIYFADYEVDIVSRAGMMIRGTLTLPKNAHWTGTLAIIVTNSAEEGRDAGGYHSDLARILAESGIASYRYDNRDSSQARTEYVVTPRFSLFDMAEDLEDVYFHFRKDRRFKRFRIGFIGLSEGGVTGLICASKNDKVSFLVQVASPTVSGMEMTYTQIADISPSRHAIKAAMGLKDSGYSAIVQEIIERTVSGDADTTSLKQWAERFSADKTNAQKAFIDKVLIEMLNRSMLKRSKDNLTYNPTDYYGKAKCPILYIACLYDEKTYCFRDLSEFEKQMYRTKKRSYTTLMVPLTHGLLTQADERRGHAWEAKHGEDDRSSREKLYKSVVKWIIDVIK